MINDRNTELLLRPKERIGIATLTRKKKGTETIQIILVHVIAVRIFPFDGSEGRGRCKQDSHTVLRDQTPESAGVGSSDRFALVENRRVAVGEGRIDDVGVAHYPTHVRGGPEDFTRLDAIDILHAPLECNHVAAVIADDSLGKTRGA